MERAKLQFNEYSLPILFPYSKSGEYLLTGTEDGCVRVYRLYSPYSLTALDRHWTLRIHDNHYGQVKTMSLSYDNQYLVTGGADGNIFIHKAELPPASKYARLDTKLTPGTQVQCTCTCVSYVHRSEYTSTCTCTCTK